MSSISIDVVLPDLGKGVSWLDGPQGVGVFLRFVAPRHEARHVFPIGPLQHVRRWTACRRYEPFWMTAEAGTNGGQVPVETQSLLAELEDGQCALFVPLVDGPFRCALQGADADGLALVAETGDPGIVGAELTGLFVAVGSDPFALMEASARSVMSALGMGRLRRDKMLPAFADKFGWCTWDAFYQDVTHDTVRAGLESFAAGGVTPRALILDDGWQSERTLPSGERRLTAFAANGKFAGDLTPTTQMAKGEFGVETFLVWHAMNGYWGGVDDSALPGYSVRSQARQHSPGILHHMPGILHHMPGMDDFFGRFVGVVAPEDVYRFFQDYHRDLRAQGVDGVKVDSQATLESVASGLGGRVSLMRHYREALEGSVHTHFGGNLINCMSCANEMLYGALNSNLTRTSTDFWPDKPESHGLHLYVNAQVSAWFGEFVHPDWDMFQSGHAMGTYHAAGRAVGGCPVYVSDKPGAHDFDLLRKLVLPDGSILRADGPGRPTRDCLFHDPTKEDVLLKIWNRNGAAGIVGVFNARSGEAGAEVSPIAGAVRPSDVSGLHGERFAVLAHGSQDLRVLGRDEPWDLTLPPLGFEVFTISPIEDGIAPLGLGDMFNSAGAVSGKSWDAAGAYEMTLRGGGRFLAWSERVPIRAEVDGDAADFSFDGDTHRLEIAIAAPGPCVLRLIFVKEA